MIFTKKIYYKDGKRIEIENQRPATKADKKRSLKISEKIQQLRAKKQAQNS